MRYTQEQMNVIIKEWQGSGLSKKAFCLQRGITHSTFHYWHKGLSASAGFTEVKVRSSASPPYELIFPNGARMVFAEPPSVNWLRELIY